MARTPNETPRRQGFADLLNREVATGLHWDAVLVWFLRAMAIVWLVTGLGHWAILLGVFPGDAPFEGRPLAFQATITYFAVIDLVAAVGLWLTSTWGGVMWLLAVMSDLILAIFFPQIIGHGLLTIAALIVLVGAYFVISWLAARTAD
jgi:hypothetical protein